MNYRSYTGGKSTINNFKRVASIGVLSILLIGGYKLLSKPKSNKNILSYYNPDKKIETKYDKEVVSGYSEAKEIFDKLLNEQEVSSNDVYFLTEFLTYASMTNSDYKKNDTFTEFSMQNYLHEASKEKRNDVLDGIIRSFLYREEELYNSVFTPNLSFERHGFDEEKAYKYFIYVTTLINGGEDKEMMFSSFYNENLFVADKTSSNVFKKNTTPLERIGVYTRLKGFLMGDFNFKYKRDLNLSSYNLATYNKTEYLRILDSKIANERQLLINQNTKNIGKSR